MTVSLVPRQLAEAVSKLAQVIESRNPNPILGFIHLEANGEDMELIATDIEVRLTTRIPCTGKLGPICVDAQRLAAAIGRIKDRGEARLAAVDSTLHVSAGRSEFTLPALDADGFPKLFEPNEAASFTVDGNVFRRILACMQPAICQDGSRYYLNGVCLQGASVDDEQARDTLLFVATDGHKGYARHMPAPGLPQGFKSVIVPTKTTAVIGKVFDKVPELSIAVGETKIKVSGGGMEMLSKLVEGTFPDWRRVMPRREPNLSYDTTTLVDAIETSASSTGTDKKGKAVRFLISRGETQLTTVDLDNPKFTGRDVCPHSELDELGAVEIGANYRYLQAMLNALDAETAQLTIQGAGAPITITAAGLDDRRIVVMPMRV